MTLASIAHGQTQDAKILEDANAQIQYYKALGAQYPQAQNPGDSGTLLWRALHPRESVLLQGDSIAFVESGDRASGLSLAAVDDAVRAHLNLPKGQGLIVTSVTPQGPAAQTGICENDILLALGDSPLGKPEDLEEHLKAAGEKPLGLILLHDGQKKTVQVQPRVRIAFGPVQPEPPTFWIGVSVSPIEPALRKHLHIPSDQGLITTEVIDAGPASKVGLKVNDILLTLGGKQLRDQGTLVDLVQKNGEKPASLEILREGTRQTIELTPQRRTLAKFTARLTQPRGYKFDFVHPGIVVESKPHRVELGNLTLQDFTSRPQASQPEGDAAKRLESISAEIKELRKAIDELSKQLKDRK
jgi:C-terminal processing protease CtpA/Prc